MNRLASEQNLDRQTAVFVFVRRLSPCKEIRIKLSQPAYDFNAGREWLKLIAVGDMQLGAPRKLHRQICGKLVGNKFRENKRPEGRRRSFHGKKLLHR